MCSEFTIESQTRMVPLTHHRRSVGQVAELWAQEVGRNTFRVGVMLHMSDRNIITKIIVAANVFESFTEHM